MFNNSYGEAGAPPYCYIHKRQFVLMDIPLIERAYHIFDTTGSTNRNTLPEYRWACPDCEAERRKKEGE